MANKPISTAPTTMGKHGRLREEEAERAKGHTFEPTQEADMARPKSESQTAKHEEDALRVKATTESREIDLNRPENRASKEAIKAEAKPAVPRNQPLDPNLGPNQMLNRKLAAEVGPGSPVARTDHTQQFKIDEDRSVNPSDKEAAVHHARHSRTEPDTKTGKLHQKPTAESNLSDHLRNAMPEPKDQIPADKRMHISDDLAAALSNKFAHHEIRYTNSGIDVLSGGEFISIDRNRLGKLNTREDLRAYIDSLVVSRHG